MAACSQLINVCEYSPSLMSKSMNGGFAAGQMISGAHTIQTLLEATAEAGSHGSQIQSAIDEALAAYLLCDVESQAMMQMWKLVSCRGVVSSTKEKISV